MLLNNKRLMRKLAGDINMAESKYHKNLKKFIERFAAREIVARTGSPVNPMLEVVRIGDRLQLDSSNANYSFGGLHRVFQRFFKKINIRGRNIGKVLVLGFGTGSVAAILRDEHGLQCTIKAVELDPEVIRLGREYFNTGRHANLSICEADAADYMREEKEQYDLIVVDVYIDFLVPQACETSGFISDLCRSLSPGGMVVFNKMIYNHRSGDEANELIRKFRSLEGEVSVVKIREGVMNKMIVYEAPGPAKPG